MLRNTGSRDVNTAQPKLPPLMTVAEFLDWDGDGHQGKLELVNGEVVAMSPASGTHALIQANLAGLIWQHLRTTKRPCRVGTEAPVVPRFHSNKNVRAPDLAVTCAPATSDKVFPDPVLIIEVLSPSNQRETWESIWACATIQSLAEVVVVDSERVHIQVFRKTTDGGWPKDAEIVEAGSTLRIESIEAARPIAEVYAGTHLDPVT